MLSLSFQLNRPVSLTVTLLKCPPGYQLDSEDTDDLECVCVTDPNILQCLEDNGTVVLQVSKSAMHSSRFLHTAATKFSILKSSGFSGY